MRPAYALDERYVTQAAGTGTRFLYLSNANVTAIYVPPPSRDPMPGYRSPPGTDEFRAPQPGSVARTYRGAQIVRPPPRRYHRPPCFRRARRWRAKWFQARRSRAHAARRAGRRQLRQ